MSKVISFSISDRYLDKLRTLYPALTDNLAAKQFLTDRLDSSLGNSLDDALDDGLDDKLKTLIESSLSSSLDVSLDDSLDGKLKSLIESELDGILEGRLDAVMGKSLTSLSDRLSMLEARLNTNLDGSLDDMEPLLKREREASIAAPIPTGEPSLFPIIEETVESAIDKVESVDDTVETVETDSINEPGTDAIASIDGTVESVEPNSSIETVASAIEDSEKKIVDSLDTSIASPIGIDESGSEPGTDAIGTVGMTAMDAAKYLKAKKVVVSYDSLNRWINREKIPDSPQGKDVRKHLTLRDKLYYPIN